MPIVTHVLYDCYYLMYSDLFRILGKIGGCLLNLMRFHYLYLSPLSWAILNVKVP